MSEYPKMLYRPGGEVQLHGHDCETRIVDGEEGELAALEEGWGQRPGDGSLSEKPTSTKQQSEGRNSK